MGVVACIWSLILGGDSEGDFRVGNSFTKRGTRIGSLQAVCFCGCPLFSVDGLAILTPPLSSGHSRCRRSEISESLALWHIEIETYNRNTFVYGRIDGIG